jgi:ABC-2 type transport system permease protein
LKTSFVAYFPASTILGRTEELSVSPWIGWLAPILGVVLFTLAVRIWTWQSRHYQSSGH